MQNTTKEETTKTKAKRKKAKVKISREDWKAIKGLAAAHNKSSFDPVDSVTPGEVAAVVIHLALEKLTASEIGSALS